MRDANKIVRERQKAMRREIDRRARNALVFGVALSMCFWIPVIGTIWSLMQ